MASDMFEDGMSGFSKPDSVLSWEEAHDISKKAEDFFKSLNLEDSDYTYYGGVIVYFNGEGEVEFKVLEEDNELISDAQLGEFAKTESLGVLVDLLAPKLGVDSKTLSKSLNEALKELGAEIQFRKTPKGDVYRENGAIEVKQSNGVLTQILCSPEKVDTLIELAASNGRFVFEVTKGRSGNVILRFGNKSNSKVNEAYDGWEEDIKGIVEYSTSKWVYFFKKSGKEFFYQQTKGQLTNKWSSLGYNPNCIKWFLKNKAE